METGDPKYQAAWEALTIAIAIKTWINADSRGMISILSDASGIISGMTKLKSASGIINRFAMEIAVHLAPLALELEWGTCLGRAHYHRRRSQ